MPLIPPNVFEHLAVKTKQLSKAAKDGMMVFGTNIFIANGAAAGQQSQHFMLHIIPREESDGLAAFEFEKIDVDKKKEEEAFRILKSNLPRLLKDIYKRFPLQGQEAPKVSYSKEELLKIIDMNPQLKQAIIKSPHQFKDMIPMNPQLKQLFQNIDVDDIIETVTGKKITKAIDSEFKPPAIIKEETIQESKQESEESTDSADNEAPDIFEVVEGNPKLKALLLNNPEELKQKISVVPQLQELFEGQDIDEIRKEFIKREQKKEQLKKLKPGEASKDIADLL
jgi:hypothetical protein